MLPFFNFSGLACVVAFVPGAGDAFDAEEVVVDEVVDDDDDSCLGMIISSAVRRRFTGVSEGGS